MPETTRLTPYRSADVRAMLDVLALGQPVAVVGLSNFGKSMLLRQMIEPQVSDAYHSITGRAVIFVYIDCNRMLQMSAQGFYEVILRAVLETLSEELITRRDLRKLVERFYSKVVESSSDFAIPLAFNDAIIHFLDDDATEDVVLLLDEFDNVLTGLDERVFLNLRALKDKYQERLNYVTATLRPPSSFSGGDDLNEFLEPFAPYKYHLQPLSDDDATELAADLFTQANDSLDPHEREFILKQAGGHPGLLQAAAHVVMEVESGAPATYTEQALKVAADVLQNHPLVRSELAKLWKQLLPDEREIVSLVAMRGPDVLTHLQHTHLRQRGLLIGDQPGDQAGGLGKERLFGVLFANYARRQGLARQQVPDGVWVDSDAGTVWVGGQLIDSLTDLEYRLLLLLYGRMDKICDKFQIVEAVWGQDYLGEVDDARIEKLVSRLRSKLEPDPARPQFIVTVRGRGYKINHPRGMPDPPNGA
ncbi:MAG: winged helix-turn-helix domain-containing protein [Anaerolineae bacterium]|nr:winged helix-turn-helix domain-containing protein [Anaerolineae bacterium]